MQKNMFNIKYTRRTHKNILASFFWNIEKRYNSAQKFKIALRVLLESAMHPAYNEENRTFVTTRRSQ